MSTEKSKEHYALENDWKDVVSTVGMPSTAREAFNLGHRYGFKRGASWQRTKTERDRQLKIPGI